MGRTYAESWAFFHASAETSTSDQPRSIAANIEISSQDFQVVRPTQPQSPQCAVLPDAAILVQIRKLQQELEDRRRAIQPGAAPEQQIQNLQQSSSLSAPSNPQTNTSTQNTSELLRCWDSCCNGRTFSNKSNFTRHQREKRKGRAELKCCFCGVGFTRATAKQAHEAERRCRNSGGNGGGGGNSSAAR